MVMPTLSCVNGLKNNIRHVCVSNRKYLQITKGVPNTNNKHKNEIVYTCKISFSGIST